QRLLRDAAAAGRPLVLAPGRYRVADIVLAPGTRIVGVTGATVLAFAGGSLLASATDAGRIELRGLVFDGRGLPLADYAPALIHLAGVRQAIIADCGILGSSKAGLALDRSGGRVERSAISGAAGAGIRAIESTGLAVSANALADCGAGIVVWRWRAGPDGTTVTGNRIARIGFQPLAEPTEPPDGINVFRAHGVTVEGNRILDCAGAGIRALDADGIRAIGNDCRDAAEGAVMIAEGTPGAVVAGNAGDTAAGSMRMVGTE
ncbi:MAG TPA: TIGR03808 family TAT-translocated repetitive protein, partial [Bauldia sp.]|nr:TIGR03808 family TAT-translocated repetitive protein [Bauldia sp.]